MGLSIFPPILVGLGLDVIVFAACYLGNYFVKTTPDFNFVLGCFTNCCVTEHFVTRAIGLGAIVTVSLVFLYFFVSRWTPVRTWTFYLAFFPLYLMSAFDVVALMDVFTKPKHWILTEYTNVKDPIMQSTYVVLLALQNGILLHFLNLVVLWRSWNGLSWRSLLLFNGSCMAALFLPFLGLLTVHLNPVQMHPVVLAFIPAAPVYLTIPFIALYTRRNFTFVKSQTSIAVRVFDILTAVFLLASIATIVAKFLIVQGSSLLPKELIRGNDPMLLFNEDLKSVLPVSIGVILLLGYLVFIIPTLAFNLYYKFQSRKPAFLWELTVVQFALIVTFQFYYIVGALFWETPAAFRVKLDNPIFWLINGLPVLATALDLISLIPYRTKAEPVSASKSKLSKKHK